MWQEFHETLANAIRAQLLAHLPPTYVALLAKRYSVDRPALGVFDIPAQRVYYPDVHVVAPRTIRETSTSGGAALAAPTVELPSALEVPQLSVEIRDIANRHLVTLIEILSPANKYGEGYREYADRRIDLMRTATHILEIDLLRQGARISLVGEPPPAPYYVYLSRSQRRPYTQVWAIGLRDRLPAVPVPLLAPDPDVALDIQAAVDACFALVGYERLLDYGAALPPPELGADNSAWVEERLRVIKT
jgi:hypothetical protein